MKGKRNSVASKHSEEEIDRISRLPDNLIHEILSFVDMEFAVQTSVLSKRWKNVWMSLPFIKLSCNSFIEAKVHDLKLVSESLGRFIGFVDKVFQFRNDSDIQMIKLGLFIWDDTSVEALNRWILAAVNHNVQQLDISFAFFLPNTPYEIPHQLLNCRSLKRLSIAFIGGLIGKYTEIILPELISLPQIETLWLNGISISNLELQRLFSSCPPMERVTIQDCDIQRNNLRNIIIDSHSLQFFALIDRSRPHLGSPINSLTCTTKISVPNVKRFRCTGFMTEDFSLENLSSVVDAHLKMRLRKKEADETAKSYSELLTEEKEVFAKRMLKYLGAVRNVHHLTLSSGFLEVLLQGPDTIYRQPPQLCNLETMNLEMRFTSGCLRSIAYILKIAPTVISLILTSTESNLPDAGDDWEVEFSLTCMFPHLKSVEIREVEGCDNELKFLRCLLKSSIVLENLNLTFQTTSDSLDRGRQVRQFRRNLRELPAASSSMKLKFC